MPLTYDYIAQLALNSNSTFSSLPTTYTDLRIVLSGLSPSSGWALRFNGDSAGNYQMVRMEFDKNGARTNSAIRGQGAIYISGAASLNNTQYATAIIDLYQYRVTNAIKTAHLQGTIVDGTSTAYLHWCIGSWNNTAAITSITLVGPSGWTSGAIATLYGITGA